MSRISSRLPRAWWLSVLLLALPLPAAAQFSAGARGFEPATGYVFEVDGTLDKSAEVYFSNAARAYLVVSPQLDTPVLVSVGTRRVDQVHIMKMAKQAGGTIDLLPEPLLDTLGAYQVEGTGVVFPVGGEHQGALREKPPLLGVNDVAALRAYSSSYAELEDAYKPSAQVVAALKKRPEDVRVEVYFGTWCPYCGQMVPRIMKLSEQLAGSKVAIEFYGLPRQISTDERANRLKINGVPTGVVFVGGKEVGRLQGDLWKVPEVSLNNLLEGS